MLKTIISVIMAIITFFVSLIGSGSGSDSNSGSNSNGGTSNGGTTVEGTTTPDEPVYDSPISYDIMTNVSYGSSSDQTLDLIIPEGVGRTLNLYVYIHGGAWGSGDKIAGADVIQKYAKEENMIGASLNYRLITLGSTKITCDTILTDLNSAMNKIYNECSLKGYKIDNAIVAGDSAGGHLALLYSYKYRATCPIDIKMVYSNCGPTDLTDINFYSNNDILPQQMIELQAALIGQKFNVQEYFTVDIQNKLLKVSPIAYVNGSSPATIFNSCGNDTLVPVSNAEKLDQTLTAAGVDHYYVNFPNSGHCSRSAADSMVTAQFDAKFEEMFDRYIRNG